MRPARRAMLALVSAMVVGGPASPQRRDLPLPFDTVGAMRGIPVATVHGNYALPVGGDTLLATALELLDAEPGGPILHARAAGRDTAVGSFNERALRFAECPFVLRVYSSQDSTRLIWSSARGSLELRCPRGDPSSFAATVSARWRLASILGDSLPPGRYFTQLSVRLADGRTITGNRGPYRLASRFDAPSRSYEKLAFRPGIALGGQAPRELRAWVVVRNDDTRPVQMAHGSCALHIRLWRDSRRRGPPVWRSGFRKHPDYATRRVEYACTAELRLPTLAPGDTFAFRLHVPFAEVLHDSLPDGRYWASLELQLLNDSLRPPEWERNYTFPVGSIELRRAPDPIPTKRTVGALTYEAASRVTHGRVPGSDSVRFFVLVTNTGSTAEEVTFMRPNAFSVAGYRRLAALDSGFSPPAWSSREQRINEVRFHLAPGRKWLAEMAVPLAELRAAAGGGGRYHFRIFMVMGNARVMSGGSIRSLSAGSVQIP